jgi:hypothetical protein
LGKSRGGTPTVVRLALEARPGPSARQITYCVCRRSASDFSFFPFVPFSFVIAGHSRSQNGVTSFAYARQSMQKLRL